MADDTPDPAAAALAEIRAAEQAATPGPWHLEWDSCDCGDGYGCSHGSWPHAIHTSRAHTERPDGKQRDYDFSHTEISELGDADAEFIIAARYAVPRLLKAVEAVLKLPAEWRRESEALRDAAGKVWEDAPDAPGVRLKHAYAAGYAECAKALEAAITAALAGKDGTDEH